MATVWADIEAMTPTDAERKLIAASRMGKPCILGNNRPNPPDPGQAPDPARTIRAPILRYLILGGCEACRVHERGVELVGAYIKDELNLSFATARGPTGLIQCWFSSSVMAMQAHLETLVLSGSALPALNANGVRVTGDLLLDHSFTADGEITLSGAIIGGHLGCRRGQFSHSQGRPALNGQSLRVTGGVFLDGGFKANGEVSLSASTIDGQLNCCGGAFYNPTGHSLNGQDLQVTGGVFLGKGFDARGEVSFSGARIGGQLSCRQGKFSNPTGHSLNGQGLQVTGDVFLQGHFEAGEVSLSGATIGGELNCEKGEFYNQNGVALNGEGLRVAGPVFLDDGFTARGEVSLSGSIIGGQLSCGGGTFVNPTGHSLFGQGLQVTGDVYLRNDFKAIGAVKLIGARIGGQLACSRGNFCNPTGEALNGQGMQVAGSFIWREMSTVRGSVVLTSAHVGDLVDDLESWPQEKDQLTLHGFTYDRISGAFTDSERRLEWLKRGTVWNGEFYPQPYAQLAKVLREMGHDRAARDVLFEGERLSRLNSREQRRNQRDSGRQRSSSFRRIGADIANGNAPHFCKDVISRLYHGYGYKPLRQLWLIPMLWLLAALLGYLAWNSGAMVPASDVVLTSPGWQAVAPLPDPAVAWTAAGAAGEDWETFNSLAWGFDVVVPVLSLGQTEAWAPSAARGPWGWLAWWGRGVLSVLGWVVVGLAAAAVTGIIRRE